VQVAALLALALAGVACRLRAWADRDADLRACARLLDALLAADLLNLLAVAFLKPLPTPYAGAARGLFHVSQALTLAWPVGVAALSWHLLTRLRPVSWMAVPWLGATASLALRYPSLRGEALGDALRQCQASGLVLGLLALLGARPDGFRVGRAHLVALALLAGLGAELSGPYLTAPFTSWWTAQVTWTLTLTAVAVAAAWRRPWTRSPAS
jgi:hypothetical protein